MFAGKKSAQIREILISESAWEEMTCLFAPSLAKCADVSPILPKILFWTEGGLSPFVSFEKVLCIQGIVEQVSPMKGQKTVSG
ncbi:hypothetical protein L0F22_14520 [Klebsiella pneumoniae]|nr:hypothetical protein [Klebsiella pneumoniae]